MKNQSFKLFKIKYSQILKKIFKNGLYRGSGERVKTGFLYKEQVKTSKPGWEHICTMLWSDKSQFSWVKEGRLKFDRRRQNQNLEMQVRNRNASYAFHTRTLYICMSRLDPQTLWQLLMKQGFYILRSLYRWTLAH